LNIITINIYDSYWGFDDVRGIFEINQNHRYSTSVTTNQNIEVFEDALKYIIMEKKHDGIEIETISSGDNNHSIYLGLLLGEEQMGNPYNIDYILEFLGKYSSNQDISTTPEQITASERFIYVQYVFSDGKEIQDFLKNEGLDVQILTTTRRTYERGASDFWIGYLIAISQNASWDLIKTAALKLKDKYNLNESDVEIATLNIEQLFWNVAKTAGVSVEDLTVVSFNQMVNNEELFTVNLKNSTEKFIVVSDKVGVIQAFKRIKISAKLIS
jgi:hypothetical protein